MSHSNDLALRRAVAQLSRCSIEDIEGVWKQLRPNEQDKIRPLLADAGCTPALQLPSSPTERVLASSNQSDDTLILADYIGELPEPLAARALACLDTAQHEAVLLALPKFMRNRLSAEAAAVALRPAIAMSLRSAVLKLSRDAAATRPRRVGTATAPKRSFGWLRWRHRT